jgi:hypothetical protein
VVLAAAILLAAVVLAKGMEPFDVVFLVVALAVSAIPEGLPVAMTFYPPMAQALALPEGHQCYGAMMIGYPKHRYHRVPTRKEPAVTWR